MVEGEGRRHDLRQIDSGNEGSGDEALPLHHALSGAWSPSPVVFATGEATGPPCIFTNRR